MSLNSIKHHSYNRESFRENTFEELDLWNQEEFENDFYADPWSDDDYCYYGWYDDYEDFKEMEINADILLCFEYETFGYSAVFNAKQAYSLKKLKNGTKKFIFSIAM
jgi:hypothetical protein